MSKKEMVEAGQAAAANGQSQVVTVVQAKAMTLSEKQRIEKLIDNRRDSTMSYLTEMKEFALAANEQTEFNGAEERAELKKGLAQIAMDRERIGGRKKGELDAVEQVLNDEHEKKMQKLKALEQKMTTKHHENLTAANEEIEEKYRQQEDELIEKETEAKLRLEELAKLEKREKLVREIALANSFRKLEDGLADARNTAVEELYTDVVQATQSKAVLAKLPDATRFRERVSPERLFQVFNTNMTTEALPLSKAVCSNCGSDNLMQHARGEIYCRDCQHYDVLPKEVKKLVALPTINEILEDGEPTGPPATAAMREQLGLPGPEPQEENVIETQEQPTEEPAAAE